MILDTARPGLPSGRDVVRGGRWPGYARGVERRGAEMISQEPGIPRRAGKGGE